MNKDDYNKDLIIFPVRCNICLSVVQDRDIFYNHPKHGFVCYRCPEFQEGRVVLDPHENGLCREPGTKSVYAPYKMPDRKEDEC